MSTYEVLFWQESRLNSYQHGGSFDTAKAAHDVVDILYRQRKPRVLLAVVTVPQESSGKPVEHREPRTFHF